MEIPSKVVDEVKSLLELYTAFTADFTPFSSFTDTAQYMLFSRSCNAFRSAAILCWEGLFVDSYNSVRIGLEAGWLALILRRSDERAREWLTLVPSDTANSDIEKTYQYDNRGLFNIAGVAFPDQNDAILVVPEKVNAAYQAMILLKFAQVQAEGLQGDA